LAGVLFVSDLRRKNIALHDPRSVCRNRLLRKLGQQSFLSPIHVADPLRFRMLIP
jgi:hypothetical protein